MSDLIRPRRSALYMPGSNARALEKAKTLDADILLLDLEDAVAPDAKDVARNQVAAAVAEKGYGHREVVVRINGLSTEWGTQDLEAAAKACPDAILVPKVSKPDDIYQVVRALDQAGCPEDVKIWAMMETPLAVLNAGGIAATRLSPDGRRLACFVIGTNDLAKETRAHLIPGRSTMLPWIQTFLAAARAHGLSILDGVFNGLDDEGGLVAECEQGLALGFDGKTLIHPKQVSVCNRVFSPKDEEVAFARSIIAAFDLPENKTKGALRLGGRMVERLHADMARELVAVADAIAAKA